MSPEQPDVISFGHPRTGSNRVAGAAVVLLTAALAIAIIVAVHYHGQVVAQHRQARNASPPAASPAASPTLAPPTALRSAGPIEYVNGNTLSFAVRGTAGAVVTVEYLRADHGREAMWLSVAIRGLPRGYIYLAKAGKCVQGRTVTLAAYSGIPDWQSGILLLVMNNIPASTGQIAWLTLNTGRGMQLGGIRGDFLVGQATPPIAPVGEVCGHTGSVRSVRVGK